MNLAVIAGSVLGLFIAAAAFVYLGRRRTTPGVVGRVFRLLAFAASVGIATALVPATVNDSGAAASYLLGVPVVAATVALIADLFRRAVGLTSTVAALVTLIWGLILGLGIGLWFTIPALLLGVAAVATVSPRRTASSSEQDA